MDAIKIDMRLHAAKTVNTFRFEGDGLPGGEEGAGPGFDLFTKRLLGGATRTVAGFGAVPANQAQTNPLRAIDGEASEFKRIPIDCDQIPG